MAYSVEDLITQFRIQIADTELPYFWSDDQIALLLDEAQREFAVQTEIFKGTVTVNALLTEAPYITIPADVIDLRRARTATGAVPLTIMNFNEMDTALATGDYGDEIVNDWENTTGEPRMLVLDEVYGKGRLVPMITADNTVNIHYIRYPSATITSGSATTELTDTRHQMALVTYARARAYGDQDADTYNPSMAQSEMAKFEQLATKFKAENMRKTRRAGTVKYGGL